jgi:hypothetical protein
VNHKRCEDCKTEYEDEVGRASGRCPECNSRFFTLVSLREVPYNPTQTPTPRVPYVPPKSQYEIEEEKRLLYEESMDPDLLAKFKHRFQLELEEIAYLEWRAMQDQWKFQVMKAEKDPKSQAIIGGFVGPQAVTTAAGVFIGTTAIRTELDEMNNDDVGESSDSSGDDEGGIAGFLGDIFS